jgi:hypothetical protein
MFVSFVITRIAIRRRFFVDVVATACCLAYWHSAIAGTYPCNTACPVIPPGVGTQGHWTVDDSFQGSGNYQLEWVDTRGHVVGVADTMARYDGSRREQGPWKWFPGYTNDSLPLDAYDNAKLGVIFNR